MPRLTVIGSGNAFNIDGRAHACYLIEDNLLLDCGAASVIRLRSLRIDLNRLDGVLFTHFHGDHFAGLPFLLLNFAYIVKRERPFEIAGPRGTESMCRRILEVTYPGMEFDFEIRYRELEPLIPVNMAGKAIVGLPVTHREESLGYRITWEGKTFAFSGDSAWDARLVELVRAADLAVVELSLIENDGSVAHVGLNQVLSAALPARRVVFSHVYDELAEEARRHGLEVADDGTELRF